MINKKKIWIVSEVFFPEEVATAYILTEIANVLALDYEVNVICGYNVYEKGKVSSTEKLNSNIILHRIKSLPLNKNNIIQRALLSFLIGLSLSCKLLRNSHKNENVLAVTNPAMIIPLIAIVTKIKSLKLNILVHDLFPENLLAANIFKSKNTLYSVIEKIYNRSYATAEILIVIGRDMHKLMQEKIKSYSSNTKIEIVENWADIENIFPESKTDNIVLQKYENLKDKIIFQFAGNIGRLQGLETIFEMAEQVNDTNIHFVMIGDGAMKNQLVGEIDKKKITNISFWESFTRNEQHIFLNACDVGIVSLADNMTGLGVPSKTYNILAAGKPILYLGNRNSEVGLLIKENQIGWNFEHNDKQNLLFFFNNLILNDIQIKGYNARKLAKNSFAKNIILKKIILACKF